MRTDSFNAIPQVSQFMVSPIGRDARSRGASVVGCGEVQPRERDAPAAVAVRHRSNNELPRQPEGPIGAYPPFFAEKALDGETGIGPRRVRVVGRAKTHPDCRGAHARVQVEIRGKVVTRSDAEVLEGILGVG